MDRALVVGIVVCCVPTIGWAQTGPYVAVVADPVVKLRAGPSDRYPEVAELKKGDSVVVYEEENGWLGVQAPPGKLYWTSWVQMQFVDFNPQKPLPQSVVTSDDIALRPGHRDERQPLVHIQRTKLLAGTPLAIVGEKAVFDEKTWYPVLPPLGDYRYLPKQSVKFENAVNKTFTVREQVPATAVPPVSPAGGTLPVASIAGPDSPTGSARAKPGVQHPIWAQAEAAERDGKYDDAERLYFALARAMNEPGGDHDVANLCYTKIHSIREKKRGSAMPATNTSRAPGAEPIRPPTGSAPRSNADPRDDRPRRTNPGRLVRSNINLDGRTTYRLEETPGDATAYVVPAAGVDLERYVGRKVEITGVTYTRQGLSKPYIVASSVEILP